MEVFKYIGTEIEHINFSKLDEEQIIYQLKNIETLNKNEIKYLVLTATIYGYNKVIEYIKKNFFDEYQKFNSKYEEVIEILKRK